MVVIAVFGILASIAVPNLQQLIRNNRVTAQNNEILSLVHLARSQAIRINGNVELQLNSTTAAWTGRIWIAECVEQAGEEVCPTNIPPDCPPQEGFVRCVANTGVNLSSKNEKFPLTLTFNGRGYLAGTDFSSRSIALQHVPCSGGQLRRELEIFATGQVDFETKDCAP